MQGTNLRYRSKSEQLRVKFAKVFYKNWRLYVLMLPAIVMQAIFCYGPMYGVQIAFKDYRTNLGIIGSEWIGFSHFERFLSYSDMWRMIKNTLRLSLYGYVGTPITICVALMLNELKPVWFKKTVQMVSYAPHFLSTVVICSMVTLFTDRSTGVINNIIELFGGTRTNFLADPKYFATLYVWSGVWQGVGWGTIIYLASLASVPQEQIEAATIDGANKIQTIWHVKLPTIRPTIIILLILSTGSIMGVSFEKTFLLKNELNAEASEVISTYTYRIGLLGSEFSYSAAIGLFNNIINIIILICVNKIAKKVGEVSIW